MNNNNSYKDKCIPIPEDSTNNTNNTNKAINTYFDIDECILGKGSFGEVCKGTITPKGTELLQRFNIPKGVDIAIKKILKHKFDMNEINILFKIKDLKYITKYYGCLYDDNYIYIIMEYIQGEELFNYIYGKTQDEDNNPRQLTPAEKSKVAINKQRVKANMLSISKQLAIAIDELHKLGIIHNDIKSENIMVNENANEDSSNNLDIKLIDYGLSCELNNINYCFNKNGNLKGTDGFMDAEFLQQNYNDIMSFDNDKLREEFFRKKDWWAYILTLYELLFDHGIPDYEDENGNKHLFYKGDIEILNAISPNLANLITNLSNQEILYENDSEDIRNFIFGTLGIQSRVRVSRRSNSPSKSPTKKRKAENSGSKSAKSPTKKRIARTISPSSSRSKSPTKIKKERHSI